jgi:hypothetical protein
LAGSGPAFTATPTIGIAATTTGALNFVGTTSGTVTLSVVDAAGTWTLKLPTSAGSNGQFLETDGSGNASWATVAGSGTVDSGTATQLAYYAASTNEVGGNTNATIVSGALTLGQGGSTIGQLKLSGNTSGTTTITPAAVASGTLTLPAVTDTLAGKALANGGTNNALTASNGGIVWSDASKLNILSGTATANQVLLSGSTATPAWSTATYPATTTINQMLYSSSANVIAGLATANGGILNANASGVPAITVTPVIGVAGTSTGKVGLSGVTSGVVTIQPASAAGTYNFNLPITVGSAGQVLTSQGGGSTAMTWTTVSTNISTSSNILSGDVSISSTNTFFDGPSMAQGSSGTWFASGSIVSINTIGAANLYCKLWDGTTTIDSAYIRVLVASQYVSSVSMSGIIASPVGNIRISCEDTGSTTSKIVFNATGLSKDSYIWGMRLQ